MNTVRLLSRGLVQVVILLSAVGLPATGQAKPVSEPKVHHGLGPAADRVLREGFEAKLPPHLSTLLDLSQELETPVMQRLLRTGKMLQGFDVSVDGKKDIVLFVVGEGTENNQTLYLTSAQGRLRKIVSVKNGEGSPAKITEEDKKAFEKEKEFWLARLAPPPAPK